MNKNVLVTGACKNTGVDIVRKFASNSWNVIFTGRADEDVNSKQKEYEKEFPNSKFLGINLEALENNQVNEKGTIELINSISKEFSKLDAIVLNAADLGIDSDIHKDDIDGFMRVMNTNVAWNYLIIEKGIKLFPKEGGSIVFINSNTAYRAIPNRVAYTTSKSAQLGMMRALALDLGKDHIRVNAVLPGMIITDRYYANKEAYESVPSRFTPLGEIATGVDVAEAAYYLTCHAKNTTGAELTVDGGNMIQLYPITK